MKYEIIPIYLPKGTKRRSGVKMPSVKFSVAHDTGNDGSTAKGNIKYYTNSANTLSASAHIFVDHTGIYECVPLLTGTPEKAWHVLYDKPKDNQMFGDDSNDIGAGVEFCFSYQKGNINNEESYKRYVWVLAYIAYKFKFPPTNVVGHHILDPGRKTDPVNALSKIGKSYEQLLKDVVNEYNECTQPIEVVKPVVTPRPIKEECKVEQLKDWQKQLGEKAIDELISIDKSLVANPEQWKEKLGEHVPNWLFFEMMKRIAELKVK